MKRRFYEHARDEDWKDEFQKTLTLLRGNKITLEDVYILLCQRRQRVAVWVSLRDYLARDKAGGQVIKPCCSQQFLLGLLNKDN
ncbi:hypothetical protein AD953_09655 [Acetobacter malorum]|uniref:Uncharacterized protein n=1 Tax=Acetobacter malorum TaxID=178901 RepID=A0A149V3W7_9PROT|nr:hypothetical protein AD953_09655 [Acetobacter malorum]